MSFKKKEKKNKGCGARVEADRKKERERESERYRGRKKKCETFVNCRWSLSGLHLTCAHSSGNNTQNNLTAYFILINSDITQCDLRPPEESGQYLV